LNKMRQQQDSRVFLLQRNRDQLEASLTELGHLL
jgi:hypothetical protein